jgi:molybdenum cofactor synthesis domain-containing protein
MGYREHKEKSPRSVTCAVLTISDSRTEQDDESGKLLKEKLSQNGHRVLAYAILKNDADSIKRKVEELLKSADLQVIITSGGTGISHRDVTVETISPVLEKKQQEPSRLSLVGFLFQEVLDDLRFLGGLQKRAEEDFPELSVVLDKPAKIGQIAADGLILGFIFQGPGQTFGVSSNQDFAFHTVPPAFRWICR